MPSSSLCLTRAGLLSVALSVSALGCSKSKDAHPTTSSSVPAGGVDTVTAPATGTGGEGLPGLYFDENGATPNANDDVAACAGQVAQAEFISVDLFIMLDISGSMLEMTSAGTDKWTSVTRALASFLQDPSSSGLGVGLQYFPLNRADVPETCGSDAECGPGGPCRRDVCLGALTQLGGVLPCSTEQDCQGANGNSFGPCTAIGECSADPAFLCQIPGLPCQLPTGGIGLCQLRTRGVCSERVVCDAATYAAPAVEIATLPRAAPPLLASIGAQVPDGGTPSGPALSGAIRQAQEWARSHPGHAVTAVLVTDGLPTDCTPLDPGALSQIAAGGFSASPSVQTFAIGVFGANDPAGAANLDAIARAGGTQSAFVIDTTEDVSARFLEALNAIRGARLGCEFELPTPGNGETLDFGRVNVDLTDTAGKTRISKVAALAACAAADGWYYDDETAPGRIIACPASCERFRTAERGSTVEIQLGCKTVIR